VAVNRPTAYGKVISENHTIKILAEKNGVLLSLTTRTYSYLVFVSRPFIGVRRVVTRDRIVARAGYDIPRVLALISESYGRRPQPSKDENRE
jgi:hypothetical protein